jgi:hypothetical protein
MVTARKGSNPEMTDTRTRPPYAALTETLGQVLGGLLAVAAIAAEADEETALAASYTLSVGSVAVVDTIAAEVDIEPTWAGLAYSATWTEGPVTVTVEWHMNPVATPDDAAEIEVPGRAA